MKIISQLFTFSNLFAAGRGEYAWNSFFTSDDQPVQINNGARKFVYRSVDRRNHYR